MRTGRLASVVSLLEPVALLVNVVNTNVEPLRGNDFSPMRPDCISVKLRQMYRLFHKTLARVVYRLNNNRTTYPKPDPPYYITLLISMYRCLDLRELT